MTQYYNTISSGNARTFLDEFRAAADKPGRNGKKDGYLSKSEIQSFEAEPGDYFYSAKSVLLANFDDISSKFVNDNKIGRWESYYAARTQTFTVPADQNPFHPPAQTFPINGAGFGTL